jgi:hypothetical protein
VAVGADEAHKGEVELWGARADELIQRFQLGKDRIIICLGKN